MQENPTEPCIFCPSFDSHTVLENDDAYARWDGYPVTQHHLLIIPKRHAVNYFELTLEEKIACDQLLARGRDLIRHTDRSVTGFNIGMKIKDTHSFRRSDLTDHYDYTGLRQTGTPIKI